MCGKITYKDVYKVRWKSRDFELTTFWQRAVLLGTFMVLFYTGYGVLLSKMIALRSISLVRWNFINLIAVGVACFGMIISLLWILLAKGSKAWIDRNESAITAFKEPTLSAAFAGRCCKALGGKSVQEIAGFQLSENKEFCEKIFGKLEDSILSSKAGAYSVSRVIVCLGQVSFLGWCLIALAHLFALIHGKDVCIGWLGDKSIIAVLAFGMIAITLIFIRPWICKQSESGSLKK